MNEYTFSMTNLNCGACIKVATMILKKIDGIESVDIKESGETKIIANKPIDLVFVKNVLKEKGGYEISI